MLNRNADVFAKHKAYIRCCNFVEHGIETEYDSVPHREAARRMTTQKRAGKNRDNNEVRHD